MKIYVTGIGVTSAIGLNASENLASLRNGKTGISSSAEHKLMLGEVTWTNEDIIRHFNLPAYDYSRTTLLALFAAKEAWGNNIPHPGIRTGLISSTSIGGLDRTEKLHFENFERGSNEHSKMLTHDNGRTTEKLAEVLGISGYIGTISTACSSGANAIMQGARLINGNLLDRVVVGGADPIAKFNMKGFSSLNIYDKEICKPFDDNRQGLNLGEGAGFLLIENEKSLSATGNVPVCILSGWDNATDAFHQTASSPTGKGASLAMIHALAKAGLAAEEIDYVNAHGTGTGNNDLSESIALQNVFGTRMPAFSSTKGFTGHTLAAAGAIEAVYCVQSIQQQATPFNINFTLPMKETGMMPQLIYTEGKKVNHVLSNSFGFGGNCTCLIFSKL